MLRSYQRASIMAVLVLISLFITSLRIVAQAVDKSNGNDPQVITAAPANDNLENAQTLVGLSGSVAGTTVEATHQANEPRHAGLGAGNSVWYQWTAPATGHVTFTTGTTNTVLAGYAGTNYADLVLLAKNDNQQSTGGSEITFAVQANQTYRIALDANYRRQVAMPNSFQLQWLFGIALSYDNFATPSQLNQYGEITYTNFGATKEPGEPDIAGNAGGKSIWLKMTAGANGSYTFSTQGSRYMNGGENLDTLLAIYVGTDVNNLIQIASNDDHYLHTSQISVTLSLFQTYYIAIDGYHDASGVATGNINFKWGKTVGTRPADFDGDGIADITVFRPSAGAWYTLSSIDGTFTPTPWGANGDVPAQGDYDGDGRTDTAVFRPSNGYWYVSRSSDQTVAMTPWGLAGDIPVAGDYNGDGNTDLAVFRPSDGNWYVKGPLGTVHFGQAGDIPVPADYDGDNVTDIAVFRPSNGSWYIRYSTTGGVVSTAFGLNGDSPVSADYDEDGRADVAVFRPSNGYWYVLQSKSNSLLTINWGKAGDIAVPGDFDGSGQAGPAVFRPSTGTWYILPANPNVNNPSRSIQFGANGDVPATAAYAAH